MVCNSVRTKKSGTSHSFLQQTSTLSPCQNGGGFILKVIVLMKRKVLVYNKVKEEGQNEPTYKRKN